MLTIFEERGRKMGTMPRSLNSTLSIVNQTLDFLSGPIVHCHWKEEGLEKTLNKVLVPYMGIQELACFLSLHPQLSKSRAFHTEWARPWEERCDLLLRLEAVNSQYEPSGFCLCHRKCCRQILPASSETVHGTLRLKSYQESQIFTTRFRCAVLDLRNPGWVGKNYSHKREKLQRVKLDVDK